MRYHSKKLLPRKGLGGLRGVGVLERIFIPILSWENVDFGL